MRPRVLGLGNDLLGDDAVGVVAARRISEELADEVEVAETSVYGLALLDVILGCRQLIILDAIKTGVVPPGTVLRLDPASFDQVLAPSPHYSGIPEMRALARALGLDMPEQIAIFAVEIADGTNFTTTLSGDVRDGVAETVRLVKDQLTIWAAGPTLTSSEAHTVRYDRLPRRTHELANHNPC